MEAVDSGLVFGIQHFSIHDGLGIRSNVFLKGCPLRCLWCHNPEGLSPRVELQYFASKCQHCGACGHVYRKLDAFPTMSEEDAERYARVCPHRALQTVGKRMSAREVIDDVAKDKAYFDSTGGGITVSGGEPMLQAGFVLALLGLARERGIATALETSGYAPTSAYLEVAPLVSTFLWDYKATGSARHKELTGVDNQRILDNLRVLHDQGASIVLRCPVIPGVNDTDEHFAAIGRLCQELPGLLGFEIMPYHRMGVSKAARVGIDQRAFEVPGDALKARWEERVVELGGRRPPFE